MKAYVVWYDNGEQWEDNYQCIKCIFSSQEKAEEHLKKLGLEKFETKAFKRNEGLVPCYKWKEPGPKHQCEKVIKEFNENGESHFNTCFDCDKDDYCELEREYEDWYYTRRYATWEIQEWDMDVDE